ncbi:DNA repair protein RecN [Enterococcus sp. LJL128]|uniref:DNA repair protein RecN n=1 Tax=Enterococcus sp. LJL51 TaxID=3416656 RepID=UPI003CF1498C
MLQQLSIKNFAIISSLELEFHEGMTVLTGETGAGKSIIIDAVGLLTGGRGSSDFIRQGASKCTLEGVFALPENIELYALLDEQGIEREEEILILQRDIFTSGKNICRVNGRIVTIAALRRIGEYLVDIHGQNEHQELMHNDRHLGMLDDFGGSRLRQLKTNYTQIYLEYRQLEKRVRDLQKNEKAFAQRIDMLQFQRNEIEEAKLQPGEEERLTEERNKLANFQKIADVLAESYEAINGEENSSLDRVAYAMNELATIETLDSDYLTISEAVQNGYYQLQEASADLSRHLGQLELDEGRLDEVENRLELIRQLKRKYGESVTAILEYYQEITAELAENGQLNGEAGELEEVLTDKKNQVLKLGAQLSSERKKTAAVLEKSILKELKELYMERTVFQVKFLEHDEQAITEDGLDQVEFYITTNPGEPLKPLVKVASGGELSRVMLALKTIFSKTQGITSIVFDEVDTGVSGRVAQAIADKIHQISSDSQVLCITHLPQVAATADYQYFISKEIADDRTETNVRMLTGKERVDEIARMLAGSEITPLTVEHAKELLQLAEREKKQQ